MSLPPDPGTEERVLDDQDARIRLLICFTCDTIEPLPWFDGPAEYDDTLNARLAGHKTPEGHPHVGNLATVSEVSWSNPERRERILEELARVRGGGEAGLGTAFYNVRNTFEEDAYICWSKAHGRTENCEDYKSDKKRLLPDTREERRELGLSTRARDRPGGAHLCDFCVYRSVVQTRVMRDRGYY